MGQPAPKDSFALHHFSSSTVLNRLYGACRGIRVLSPMSGDALAVMTPKRAPTAFSCSLRTFSRGDRRAAARRGGDRALRWRNCRIPGLEPFHSSEAKVSRSSQSALPLLLAEREGDERWSTERPAGALPRPCSRVAARRKLSCMTLPHPSVAPRDVGDLLTTRGSHSPLERERSRR